jgi:hypothetical protein
VRPEQSKPSVFVPPEAYGEPMADRAAATAVSAGVDCWYSAPPCGEATAGAASSNVANRTDNSLGSTSNPLRLSGAYEVS